jgi:hypothetical protein
MASRYSVKPTNSVLWSKTTTGQTNEALLNLLCHNICVLVQSIYELGIAPVFWPHKAAATMPA